MTTATKPTRTQLVEEAIALERAGVTWSVFHVAAITGYGTTYIRNSSCPRHREATEHGVKKDRLVFIPAEVRAWKASLIRRSA